MMIDHSSISSISRSSDLLLIFLAWFNLFFVCRDFFNFGAENHTKTFYFVDFFRVHKRFSSLSQANRFFLKLILIYSGVFNASF
jgi:uncharacterized protein involved in cysteine biosynthesis